MEEKTNLRSTHPLEGLPQSTSGEDKITKKRMSFASANSDLKSVNSRHKIDQKTITVNSYDYEVLADLCYINDEIPWYRRIKLWFNRLFRRW